MFNDSPLIKTNYKIIKQLGEGSFGRVYLANSYHDKVTLYTKLILVLCSN